MGIREQLCVLVLSALLYMRSGESNTDHWAFSHPNPSACPSFVIAFWRCFCSGTGDRAQCWGTCLACTKPQGPFLAPQKTKMKQKPPVACEASLLRTGCFSSQHHTVRGFAGGSHLMILPAFLWRFEIFADFLSAWGFWWTVGV